MDAIDEPEDPYADLVDIADIREILAVGRTRAYTISTSKGFPDPVVDHPRVRLWRRRDVEAWLDRYRPGWRDTPGGADQRR